MDGALSTEVISIAAEHIELVRMGETDLTATKRA